jgi:predicted amidohydrolase YtcJ
VADTLYINGHIRLVDHDKQIVEALYESQRGIAFVGATQQTSQLISDKTKIIEVV